MRTLINKLPLIGIFVLIAVIAITLFKIAPKEENKHGKAYLNADKTSLTINDLPPRQFEIINMHEHVQTMVEAERLLKAMDKFGVRRTCLMSASIYTFTLDTKYGFDLFKENNEELIRIKKRWPDRYCAFVTIEPTQEGNLQILKQYAQRGADGLKLYLGHGAGTGKGPFHMMPLDDPRMEPIWAWAEQSQFPIVIHVNLTKYWDEFLRVMERHPFLRLSIPHLGLHKNNAARLDRLGWLLNRYPNLYTDISFGFHTFHKEGFEALAKWRSRSNKFLTEHALKTFYASDMVLEASKDNEYIDNTLRSYMQLLEMKAFRFFLVPDAIMHGLDLNTDTLRKIYVEAPIRFLNEKNRKLPDLSKIRKTGELIEGFPPSTKMPKPIAYDPAPPEK